MKGNIKKERILIDGLEYVKYTDFKSGLRLAYNPELHESHSQNYSKEDCIYLCKYWSIDKKKDIALALGRTVTGLYMKKHNLVKSGEFEYYKNLEE